MPIRQLSSLDCHALRASNDSRCFGKRALKRNTDAGAFPKSVTARPATTLQSRKNISLAYAIEASYEALDCHALWARNDSKCVSWSALKRDADADAGAFPESVTARRVTTRQSSENKDSVATHIKTLDCHAFQARNDN